MWFTSVSTMLISYNTQGFQRDMEDFVTLDEVGDVEDLEGGKLKMEVSESAENQATKAAVSSEMASTSAEDSLSGVKSPPDSESATNNGNLAAVNTEYDLGPYQPNNPVGKHVFIIDVLLISFCSIFFPPKGYTCTNENCCTTQQRQCYIILLSGKLNFV